MSEEEKKAIEMLEFFEPDDLSECAIYRNALKVIENLIEKQEKEIQGLNKQASELVDDYEKQLQEKNEYIFRLENEREQLLNTLEEEF